MDSRIWLRIPPDFAYVMRVGGANFRDLEFHVSLAIALRGVRAVCLIGHDDCAMTGIKARRAAFVRGLIENAGWNRRQAESHFKLHARFEVGDAIGFVRAEATRLSQRYHRVVVAPLFYSVVDRALYQVDVGISER
jgi:carbonic anhydrase